MAFEKTVFLPLDPDAVFELITQPDRLRRWKTVAARVDLRVGGEYRWTVLPGHWAAGRFQEIEPGKRVVLSWPSPCCNEPSFRQRMPPPSPQRPIARSPLAWTSSTPCLRRARRPLELLLQMRAHQKRSVFTPELAAEQTAAWGAWMGKVGGALVDIGAPFAEGAAVTDDGSAYSHS